MPVTKTLGSGGLVDPSDVSDILAPKPLQPSKLSLIGGTVKSIDQIRDRMAVHIYDANTMNIKFDQRTHFFRDGKETTQLGVKKGDRVYLDTQLFEGTVYAKNVHVESSSSPADASGQIMSFDRKHAEMVVQDNLAGTTVRFRITPQTQIKSGDMAAPQSSLRPGALIAVKFSPRSHGAAADEVSIIAEPGTSFTYFGRVTHLDIRTGQLDVENRADGKIYEIHFDPSMRIPENLLVGSTVTVIARFEGNSYAAQNIEVNAGPDQALASPNSGQSQNANSTTNQKKPSSDEDQL
jgi:hypothetical protein